MATLKSLKPLCKAKFMSNVRKALKDQRRFKLTPFVANGKFTRFHRPSRHQPFLLLCCVLASSPASVSYTFASHRLFRAHTASADASAFLLTLLWLARNVIERGGGVDGGGGDGRAVLAGFSPNASSRKIR